MKLGTAIEVGGILLGVVAVWQTAKWMEREFGPEESVAIPDEYTDSLGVDWPRML